MLRLLMLRRGALNLSRDVTSIFIDTKIFPSSWIELKLQIEQAARDFRGPGSAIGGIAIGGGGSIYGGE